MAYHHAEQITLTMYVLHSRPYRDTSAIITAFSAEMGKITFVAKGIRSKKNPKIALLQPFIPLNAQVYGKNELKNLATLESLGIAIRLTDIHLYSALYLNELLMRLLPVEVSCLELYQGYESVLQHLSDQQPLEPLLRDFEIGLLNELGYGVDYQTEQSTGKEIEAAYHYHFDPEQGFTYALPHQRNVIGGQAIVDIAQQVWNQSSLKAAKYINRIALKSLLGDKPLKSRELFGKH